MPFLAAMALLGLPLVAPGATHAQTPTFTDAHVHLNDADGWVGLMDELGVEEAIVLRGRDADHETLLAAGRAWPDRLFPFVSVSPEHREYRAAWSADNVSLAGVVDSLLSVGGFRGIGEISVSHFPGAGFPEADFDPDGRLMRAILEVARRHRVPVLVHSEVTRLREFESLLRRFPDVDVVWAHGGYTPLHLARRLLETYPNLTYELSARTWVVHPRSPDYTILRNERDVWPQWLELVESMSDRFVVGSDASLRSLDSDREKVRSVGSFLEQLSPAARSRVARRNIRRLLGM